MNRIWTFDIRNYMNSHSILLDLSKNWESEQLVQTVRSMKEWLEDFDIPANSAAHSGKICHFLATLILMFNSTLQVYGTTSLVELSSKVDLCCAERHKNAIHCVEHMHCLLQKWSETHFHYRRQQRVAVLSRVSKESNKVVSCITAEHSAEVQRQAFFRCPPDVHIHKLEFIQNNHWNPDELHPGCFGNILKIACFNYGIHCKHLLTLLERPMELAEQHLHVSQANTPTSASFVRTSMKACSWCGQSVHMVNMQHCYELDRYNQPTIWLCSELCHSRQQLAFYRAHILPARTDLCVVVQTYEPTPAGKGILLLQSNWMAQPFNELSGCRYIARWFPRSQYSNYCQRNLLQ